MVILKEKGGISVLIATVLLILIVVVAVGIIWAAVMPLLTNFLGDRQACIDVILTINTESGYTCYDPSNGEVEIMIRRGPEEFELAGMELVASGGGKSIKYGIKPETNAGGLVKIIDGSYANNLTDDDFPGKNEERTYVANVSTFTIVEEVKVAPIVNIGNREKTCGVSSTITLDRCA